MVLSGSRLHVRSSVWLADAGPHGYHPPMSEKLDALLERLKSHQRDLIFAMADHDGMPSGNLLRQVAELENVIAAVEAVADEQAARERRG